MALPQVGRLKILTNTVCHAPPALGKPLTAFQGSGHAFILRRFDTSAVSVTTMFRAAFPNASDMEEKTEINWIKEHYDLSGNNGTLRDQHIARLAGVWASPDVALELGADYKLGALINVVIDALPDPAQNYRRSGKAGAGLTSSPQVAGVPVASPAHAQQDQPVVKRRKESSPAAASTQTTQPPRRSTRTKSPAPRSTVQQFSAVVVPRTPKTFKTAAAFAARRIEVTTMTSGGSEETVVEHDEMRSDVEKVIDHVAGDELREQDISEQKELIKRLKAQREAQKTGAVEETEEEGSERDQEQEQGEEQPGTNGKRIREDEEAALQFNFREPETEERQIATNSRVEKWRGTKRVAWGVAAFAAGLGAV